MHQPITIDADTTTRLLPMVAAIQAMERLFAAAAQDAVVQPLRLVTPLSGPRVLAAMPAWLKASGVAGAKVLTVFPDNSARGLPSHQGLIALFDVGDGRLLATVDAEAVTAVRTAAVSGLATRILARPDAETLLIVGAGRQAVTHFHAMCAVRPIRRVILVGKSADRAQACCQALREAAEEHITISVGTSVEQAAREADIICTVTNAVTPVLASAWVAPGTHINAVGACRPTDRELDTALVRRADLYVDDQKAAEEEAGDYLVPLHEGALPPGHIRGTLADLVSGATPGRTRRDTVTLFESVGLAAEDVAAADVVYRAWQARSNA